MKVIYEKSMMKQILDISERAEAGNREIQRIEVNEAETISLIRELNAIMPLTDQHAFVDGDVVCGVSIRTVL